MSYYVKDDGAICIEAGTLFPLQCPECKVYVPLRNKEQFKQIFQKCWNCNYLGFTDEFDWEIDFKPQVIM